MGKQRKFWSLAMLASLAVLAVSLPLQWQTRMCSDFCRHADSDTVIRHAEPSAAGVEPVSFDAKTAEPNDRMILLIVTRYRLLAERDGYKQLRLKPEFRSISRNATAIVANEQRFLDARRLAFESQQRDHRLRISLVRREIEALESQRQAKEREMALFQEELRAIEKMEKRQLASLPRVLGLKRDVARTQWDIGSVEASLARSNLLITEIEQQINDARHRLVVESEKEIRDLDVELGALARSATDAPPFLIEFVADLEKHRSGGPKF